MPYKKYPDDLSDHTLDEFYYFWGKIKGTDKHSIFSNFAKLSKPLKMVFKNEKEEILC